ncbi:obscurin-like protein 1 isoform X1 [Mizuhopecten yessoensis]|uniref:obscurin-like protein 1 isoform X1 n=1 Tax=Mizuhopecten yessoensis TaxID=6573 RepID=UPI000B45E921|nr:obscurin-like protein 1 isoform X1 [Mizuhopecten yessoensis]
MEYMEVFAVFRAILGRVYCLVSLCWILHVGSFIHLFAAFFTGIPMMTAIDFQSTLDPKFNPTPTNVTFMRGDLAILSCSVENLGTKYVIWRRTADPNPLSIGNTVFVADDRYHVNYIDYRVQWDLYIKNVSRKDAGLYECQVSSRERNIRRVVFLTVIEPPATSPKPTSKPKILITGSEFVEIGNKIYLMCNATTDDFPNDDLDWFKDGHEIIQNKNDQHITITKFVSLIDKLIYSVLTVNNVKMEDAGKYVCRTSDLHITSTLVNVLSEPDKHGELIDPTHPPGAKSSIIRRSETAETDSTNGYSSAASSLYVLLPLCTIPWTLYILVST